MYVGLSFIFFKVGFLMEIPFWFPMFVVAISLVVVYAIFKTLITVAGEFQKFVDGQEEKMYDSQR